MFKIDSRGLLNQNLTVAALCVGPEYTGNCIQQNKNNFFNADNLV